MTNICISSIHLDSLTIFSHINEDLRTDKCVKFSTTLSPEVRVNSTDVTTHIQLAEVTCQEDVEKLLKRLALLRPCAGFNDEGCQVPQWTEKCSGCIEPGSPLSVTRCLHCRYKRRSLQKRKKKLKVQLSKTPKMSKKLKTVTQKVRRQKKKVRWMPEVSPEKS